MVGICAHPWEGLLENEANREGSRAQRCNGKDRFSMTYFPAPGSAVPEADILGCLYF